MGSTAWSDDLYRDRAKTRTSTGTSFSHDADIRTRRVSVSAHPTLSPLGLKVRESRDSAAHPLSRAIGVIFDVTGSMASFPKTAQSKLNKLMSTLLDKGYCVDPQILVGAVGDATSDRVPFQLGQFESGIEIDEQLDRIYLEGNGGGHGRESYELALYAFARHTAIDCWEKRGEKGILVLMGDELPYEKVSRQQVLDVFGDTIQEDISIQDIVREVQEKWHLFYILPAGTSGWNSRPLLQYWRGLVGAQNVLLLENPDLVCELVGATVGMLGGSVTLDAVAKDLGGGKDALVVRNALTGLTVAATSTGGVPVAGHGSRATRL